MRRNGERSFLSSMVASEMLGVLKRM